MSVIDRIQSALADSDYTVAETCDDSLCIEIEAGRLHEVMTALRDACGFEMSTFVTAIDRQGAAARFELNYGLLSVTHNDRLRVRTRVADGESVASVTDLWPGANFSERECFDMFGIGFDGHPDLRRLLMPEGYDHHPLRKDFPHQGIEPDRLYREWERSR
ncbi:MAG: NADH-quinone oxidoreductase subunit C [Chlamydiales bacterium]|jgi:NADH-quinone oxidoreductase subunit C